MERYLKLHAAKLALSAGIVGAVASFLTTAVAIWGNSNIAYILSASFWGFFGYNVSWPGAFIGLVIGFVYTFVPVWITTTVYNKLVR